MKKITHAIFILCLIGCAIFGVSTNSFAQNPNGVIRCYTDEQHAIRMAEHPEETEQILQFEQWIEAEMANPGPNKIIGGVYQIPVVVHVIHNGEAVGTGTNISFAAIQSQIDVLNEDFRRIFGTNGYNTNPLGADTQIEFCLAKRRPNGTAFSPTEPGVNRINRNTLGWTAPPHSTAYIDATIKPYTYGNPAAPTATQGWDPAKYMNFWVCDISGGILGYAQFPQTPIGGMGCGAQSAATDGVVMLYNSIGKSSVTGFGGVYNEGRTATHEIGHWLGLRHIWGDGGCTVDDFCNDTPEAAAANFGCPVINSCTNAPDPGNDMVANYMDYTDDLCMNIFTQDQKQRMRTVLENSPLRVSLINSDACVPPNTNDASIVDVINPMGDNCAGSITPTVVLRNRGSAALTTCTINYTIDGGAVTTFNYTGSVAAGASVNVNLPAFTAYLGTHVFKAYSVLPNGAVDPSTIYDTTSISFVVSNGITAPYSENFDGQVFPPDLRWVVQNTNSDCFEWVAASAVSISGVFANNAAQFPGFNNNVNSIDYLITPIFTLPCNASLANIQFDVAYRRRNNTAANYDRLYVEISQDCGNTWTATPIYDKAGTTLQTSTTASAGYYQPAVAGDWRTETVDLLPFVTTTSKNVKFRFRAAGVTGNNIYVDNLRFNATTPAEVKVTQTATEILDGGGHNVGTVTTCTTTNTTFTVTNTGTSNLILTGPITISGTAFTVATTFGSTTLAPNATTTFVVAFNPQVAGSFSETLSFGTNDCDEGTYNFLLLGTATGPGCGATASYTATPNPACTGQNVTFTSTSSGATSYSWNFGVGATPATASTVGPHTVSYSSAGVKTVTLQINGAGPTATNTVTVNATPATPTITAGGPTTFCSGGSVVLTSSSATGNVWSTGATTQSITVTTSGTYTVAVTTGGCTSATSAGTTVTVNPTPATPTITAGGPTTFCSGGSVVLTSSSATGNVWSTGATTQSITVLTSGTYTVSVTSGGCTSATSTGTTVTVNPTPATPTITAGGPTTFCSGGSVVLTSSSATGNVWSTGATTQSITVSTSGTYTVSVTTGGCTSATSAGTAVTVNVLPAIPTITAGGPTTFCSGGSVVLTSSTATSYSWSTTATTQAITVSTSGSYTVTVTNPAGCTRASAATNVTVNPTPVIAVGTVVNPTTCTGTNGSIQVTGTGNGTLTWSGPVNGSQTVTLPFTITALSAGSYSISFTSTAGCGSNTLSQTLTGPSAPATPIITAGGPTTFCSGGTVVLTSSAATGYTWSTGATTQSITVSTSGSYTVTVSNASGCTAASAPTTVTVNPTPTTPTITAGGPTTFCSGGTVVLTSSSASGNVWSTGATTQSITVSTSGTYSVTVTSGGCTSTASAGTTVTVNPTPATPTITAGGATTFCSGGSVVLTSSSATGNVWSTGATSQSITVTTSGTYTVAVTTGGCTSGTSAGTTVTVNPTPATPTITAGGATTFCSGGSVVLTSSSATGNVWSTGATTQSITVSTSGTYSVTVTSGSCTSTASAGTTVTVNPTPATPTITAGGPTTFCSGGSVVLTSSSATGNVWSTGATTQSITVTTSGTYTVAVTTGGCTSGTSAGTTVTVNPTPATPTITAGGATTFCSGGSVVLTSSSATGNVWSTGATTQSITVSTSGTYSVTVTSGSCTSTASAGTTVIVNPIPATPTVTAGGPTTFCAGGSVVLTSSSATGNVWSTGATTQSITVSTSGTYTVSVTSGGCTSATSAGTTVTVNAVATAPTITAGGSTSFCSGGSVVLTASAGSTYQWSNGVTTQSFTATIGGTYTVTVSNGAGCDATSTPITVTVNSNPVISIGQLQNPTLCGSTDGSIGINGSTSGNLSWSGTTSGSQNGTTLPSVIPSFGAGAYSFTLVDINGCTSNTVATSLNDPNAPIAPVITANGSTTLCAGGNVILTSSYTTGNLWSTGETTQSILVSASGTYSVTVTSGVCSSNSTPVTVTVAAPVQVNAGVDQEVCLGTSVTLTAIGAVTYSWNNGVQNGVVFTPVGSNTYSVIGFDANGCQGSDQVFVTVNTAPSVIYPAQNDVCTYTTPFTMSGGLPAGGTYSGNGITNNIFDPSQAGLGTSTITYVFTDANGCQNSAISSITVDGCASIAENAMNNWSVFPNPSNGIFTVQFSQAAELIQVYDLVGKLVLAKEIVEGASETQLDLTSFADGIYTVRLTNGNATSDQPIVLKH